MKERLLFDASRKMRFGIRHTSLREKLFGLVLIAATLGFNSCSSNDDGATEEQVAGTDIIIDGDQDCCTAGESRAVYNFLITLKNIPELNTVIDGKYNIFGYSKTGKLHTGFNEVYFISTKISTGNYIKNFQVTNITPLMTMGGGMQHSAPAADSVASFNENYLAVKKGWVSFVMPSSDNGSWTLSYDVRSKGVPSKVENAPITVDDLPSGQNWVKSFKYNNNTYYLSLVEPNSWITGTNTIKAYVSKQSNPATTAFKIADETFTIDIDPRMPDMGNHTSTGNTSLTKQSDGSYQGSINLTMTGFWRIHLTVKNSNGTVIAGGDELNDGFSSLYWDVTI